MKKVKLEALVTVVEAIEVRVRPIAAYRRWKAQWDASGLHGGAVTQYATWFDTAETAWLEAVSKVGFELSEHNFSHCTGCRYEQETLRHRADRRGPIFRLVVEEVGPSAVLRGRFCQQGLTDEGRDDIEKAARAMAEREPGPSVEVVRDAHRVMADFIAESQRRWEHAAPAAVTARRRTKSAEEGRAVEAERLRREAAKLGMKLVPNDA